MKRVATSLMMTALLLSGLAADAVAGNRGGTFSVSPMIGAYDFEGDQDLDEGVTFGLGVGYNLTDHLGLEGALHYLESAPEDDGDTDIDTFVYHVDALLHLRPEKTFVPYLALGIGGITFDPEAGGAEDDLVGNYGLGFKFYFDKDIATRFDVRHMYAFDDPDNNVHVTLGLVWQLGGDEDARPMPAAAPPPTSEPAPAPAPMPKDSDGDGVYDDVDRCPDTPAGVAVDDLGCPRDSDGDGVADYLDKCPDTPKGVLVDADGCPFDSDGDGVPDYLDQCPDTLPGVIVDEVGCEIKLTLNINFDVDKAVIKDEFDPDLKRAAEFIGRYPDTKILVAGHTDSTASEAYNQGLSERRASAVRQALIERFDVDADRMVARGYGETRPVADNSTAEGRYQNRRVEIICCYVIPPE